MDMDGIQGCTEMKITILFSGQDKDGGSHRRSLVPLYGCLYGRLDPKGYDTPVRNVKTLLKNSKRPLLPPIGKKYRTEAYY